MRDKIRTAYRNACTSYDDLLTTVVAIEEELLHISAPSRLDYFKSGCQFDKRVHEKRKQFGANHTNTTTTTTTTTSSSTAITTAATNPISPNAVATATPAGAGAARADAASSGSAAGDDAPQSTLPPTKKVKTQEEEH